MEDDDAAVGIVVDPLTDSLQVSITDQQQLSDSSAIAIGSSVGTALKKGISQTLARTSHAAKRKRTSRPSWRERLANQQDSNDNGVSEGSDFDTSSEIDSEGQYSDWTGFSDGDEAEDLHDNAHTNPQAQSSEISLVAPHILHEEIDNDPGSSDIENSSEDEDDGDVQTRAKEFKKWAREQSGFGGSISNISSLPQLPTGLKKPHILTVDEPVAAKVENSKPVPPPSFILTLVLLYSNKQETGITRNAAFIANYFRGAADHGNS